jgi:hypothetical protein
MVSSMDDEQRREAREWARRLVKDWPQLTDEQLGRLRRILRGPRGSATPATPEDSPGTSPGGEQARRV